MDYHAYNITKSFQRKYRKEINMKRFKNYLAVAILATILFTSCETPKLGYFQDVQTGTIAELSQPEYVRLHPGDKLSILVSSKNPELAYLFNLPVVGHYQSSTSGRGLSTSTVSHYTIGTDGTIDFPVLGKLAVSGLTRSEVANLVKSKLLLSDMIKDPVVTVDFLDMYFAVTGEVSKPGRFIINHDKTTLFDALSQAGDITINGRRDNVLILREVDGKQVAYRLDLRNSKEIYSSPAFYIQQNDVVYVEPNAKRARESQATGNSWLQPSLWISLASFLVSLAVLIIK